MPSFACSIVLSANEFRDKLRLQYYIPLLSAFSHCDGYNSKFSTLHALSYKVRGLVWSGHDESRDTLICLASMEFMPSNVREKPLNNHIVT